MKIYPFQAVIPDTHLLASEESFFGRVKYDYPEFVESGFFTKASKEGFYIYEITRNGTRHLGFFAAVDITDYDEGHILKHEKTLASNEQKMMQLLLHRKAMVKPVLLSYSRVDEVHDFMEKRIAESKPFLSLFFKEEKTNHKVWQVTDGESIAFLHNQFEANVPLTYIADGHHRSSSLSILNKNKGKKTKELRFDQLYTAFFSFDQLQIHEYNRVIEALDKISPSRLIAELSEFCNISYSPKPFRPGKIHEMALVINREWYKLTWKKKTLKAFPTDTVITDTQLLNTYILEGILGIKDIRNDDRIKYVEGIKELEGLLQKIQKNDTRVGFALYPLPMEDFIAIADHGEELPPKSTWFEPRMKNGLLVQDIKQH